jgi:hypothetical protein
MAQQGAPCTPVSAVGYRWAESNVFNAISRDKAPADKLFDRPHWFALLDKAPVAPGHALLITKHPAATLLEPGLPAEAMADALGELQVCALLRGAAQRAGAGAVLRCGAAVLVCAWGASQGRGGCGARLHDSWPGAGAAHGASSERGR